MEEPRFCKAPETEGYYIVFTPYGERDYDYDAVRIISQSNPPDDMVCVGNDGSRWNARELEHVWYYGPIDCPPGAPKCWRTT